MILLAAGVLSFALVHLILAVPRLKLACVERFPQAFWPIFAGVAAMSVGAMIWGWHLSEVTNLYAPPPGGRYVTFPLVLAAFLCLGIFLFRGRLRQSLRFPLAIGIILWGVGHLFANGDLASLILFGGMAAYGAAHMALGLANGIRPSPDMRAGHDTLSLLIGAALFGAMTQLHPVLIGVPVVDLGAWGGTG